MRSPPGGQAASPSDQHSPRQMGDLAETSAVCVDGVDRFIAARYGGVEFAALEEERRAVG